MSFIDVAPELMIGAAADLAAVGTAVAGTNALRARLSLGG